MAYDLEQLKSAASGRWYDIIAHFCGIQGEWLDGRHHPCPKCGGTDRFNAYRDFSETGGMRCNQCFADRNQDGIAAIMWMRGLDFKTAIAELGEYLGIKPSKTGKRLPKNPASQLEFKEWNDQLISLWCMRKAPIKPDALRLVGARLAIYRRRWSVIAIPVWPELPGDGKPCGWTIYEVTGKLLPVKSGSKTEWKKIKNTAGSQPGVIGHVGAQNPPPNLASELVKTEGPSDMLALLSMTDRPPGVGAVCNAMGSKEDPQKNLWVQKLFCDRPVWVIHDADEPGQEGATFITRSDGSQRPGWAPVIARYAPECKNVQLPYVIERTHGKDLRDWIADGNTFADLVALANAATVVTPSEEAPPSVLEADDDPHRLARVNLDRYASYAEGATIRYWRSEWYTWKRSRGCYRKISDTELRAKITQSVKQEFDRLNVEAQLAGDDEPGTARKVTTSLVTNVLHAMSSMVLLPDSVDPNTWIDAEGHRQRRNFVSMRNGLLDLDALLNGEREHHFPHSPHWFALTCREFEYDPSAKCPIWKRTVEQNMEGDQERIALLQEWAGYLLLADTSHQKFMVLEGEGANGKSVYMAGLEAMLGADSCSHVPLEVFGDRFSRTQTLGKLLNIAADCGEIDRISEGYLKSFTGGETMFFDRKGLSGVSCLPTARLMLGTNNRPRFSDKSDGIWRRMLLVPFRRTVPHEERILGMDKASWWLDSGEVPGIFNWAICGLYRLREQGEFTRPAICEDAAEDYRNEVNPAREFLLNFFESDENSKIKTDDLYKAYVSWCGSNGYRNLGSKSFGREVFRVFKKATKQRMQIGSERIYFYVGISEISSGFSF